MKSKDLSSLLGALLALVLAGSNLGCGGSGPPPVVATQLGVSVSAANATAGTAVNVTVRAVDASGALATTYAGTVHFTSRDAQATLPADSKLTGGTGTFSVTFKTAGSQTVSVDDTTTASIAGISAVVVVNSGAAMQLTLTAASPETMGFSFTLSVSAADAYGNAATGYTGTVHFTSSDAQATLPANAPLPNGSGSFPGVTLKTIGSQTITATDTVTASLKGTTSAINVVSNAATHLSVSGPANTQARATFKLTVSARDAANNVSAGYSGTVHFTSSDAQAMLPADSTLAAGTAQFSATLETSGTQTLTATDTASASINGSSSISVAATAPLALNLNCNYTQGGCTSTTAPPNGVVGNLYYQHFVTHCINLFHCFRITLYGFPLAVTGGVPPFNWSWAAAAGSSLPPGLNVSNSPNQISGTPMQPGTYNIVLTVADSGLPSAQTSQNYSITITLPPPPVVNTAHSQISAVLNQPLSYTFTATGNSLQQPFTWSETGALPAGLAFASGTGTLSGTPTQTGLSQISVTATDQFNQTSAAADFTIVVTTHGFLLTGSMATPRRFHTATLLPNGKVLVAGGQNASYTAVASAELYDPSSGTFSATGNMTVPRAGHTATLLNNGKVLIAGGNSDISGAAVSSAELYDPSTGTFTATTGTMTAARVSHTATLLQSGKVLIAGGDVLFYNPSGQSLASAEIFDPSTGTFTAAGSMTVPRESHTATLLTSGKVLITGGSDGTLGYTATTTLYASSETFDPSTGQFTAAGMMTTQRLWQTASLLASGRVLVAGGDSVSRTEATADLFDPTSGSFAATGNMTEPRFYHAASTLNDGTVLISGGLQNGENAKATAEIYDPTAGTFAATGSMNAARIWHTSTVLPNGKVLITGGADPPLATAELYQ